MSNWARIAYMDRCLNDKFKKCFTVNEIAEKFEVSTRQVKKDIEYMRYQLQAPIVYNKALKRYEYDEPFQLLRIANRQLLLTCSFLRSILKVSNYLPIVAENLTKKLDELLGSDFLELSKNIVYQLSRFELIDNDMLGFLTDSMMNKRQLKIDYENLEGEKKEFIIEPFLILNYSGDWYVIAYNHKPESLGVFKLSRINKISILDDPFVYHATKEELDTLVETSFGAFKDSEDDIIKKVTLRFYDYAYRITKNMIFHHDQVRTTGENNRGEYVEFEIPVKVYPEILSYALQYGASCEVIAPEEFRELWLKEIKKMAEIYIKR